MQLRSLVSGVTLLLLGFQTPLERATAAPDTIHGAWIRAASMPAPVMSQEEVLLHDGRVMVLGGESMLGVPVPWTQLYDPSTRAWSIGRSMHLARIGSNASVLRDGRVLVVGGIHANMNDLASAELWAPGTNT